MQLPPAATPTSSTGSSSSTGSNPSPWWSSSSSTESSVPSQTAEQPRDAVGDGKTSKSKVPGGMIIPAPKNFLPPAVPHNIVFVGCPLCLEPAIQPCVTRCGHVFCGPCITEALDAQANCPVCRLDAKPKHLRKIFLANPPAAEA